MTALEKIAIRSDRRYDVNKMTKRLTQTAALTALIICAGMTIHAENLEEQIIEASSLFDATGALRKEIGGVVADLMAKLSRQRPSFDATKRIGGLYYDSKEDVEKGERSISIAAINEARKQWFERDIPLGPSTGSAGDPIYAYQYLTVKEYEKDRVEAGSELKFRKLLNEGLRKLSQLRRRPEDLESPMYLVIRTQGDYWMSTGLADKFRDELEHPGGCRLPYTRKDVFASMGYRAVIVRISKPLGCSDKIK